MRSLAEAEWASGTARHVSTYQEHYYRLPPSALACHQNPGADVWPAQLQGQWWPIGADCFGEADLLLRGNCLFCIELIHLHLIHTHNGDSLSLGFWVLIKLGLPLARHPKTWAITCSLAAWEKTDTHPVVLRGGCYLLCLTKQLCGFKLALGGTRSMKHYSFSSLNVTMLAVLVIQTISKCFPWKETWDGTIEIGCLVHFPYRPELFTSWIPFWYQ